MSIYLDAITALEERGWQQGEAQGRTGSLCVLAAVTCQGRSRPYMEVRAGWEVLDRLAGGSAIDFNDDPHTTYEDVVLLLKRAHEVSEDA